MHSPTLVGETGTRSCELIQYGPIYKYDNLIQCSIQWRGTHRHWIWTGDYWQLRSVNAANQ